MLQKNAYVTAGRTVFPVCGLGVLCVMLPGSIPHAVDAKKNRAVAAAPEILATMDDPDN